MAGLATIASKVASGNLNEKYSVVSLWEANPDGTQTGTWFTFQYFPETLSDTKQVNYQRRNVPGTSLPIYQWISSGERSISFTAYFTSDVDLLADDNYIEEIESSGIQGRNVDIRTALLRLRGYLLPEYVAGDAQVVTVAPRRLYLQIFGSGLGLAHGHKSALTNGIDMVYCVMTQCDITWEQFFPSGLPRIASVQLAFAEVAQKGGSVVLPSFTDIERQIVTSGSADQAPRLYKYTIGPRK